MCRSLHDFIVIIIIVIMASSSSSCCVENSSILFCCCSLRNWSVWHAEWFPCHVKHHLVESLHIYIQRLSTTGAVNDRICIVSTERWRFRMRMTMNLCFSFAHHRIFSVCVQRQWDDTLWVHNGGTRIFDSWETEHARMLEKRFVLILIFSYSRQIWFSYAEWKFDLPGKRWERIFDYFVVLKGEEILFFFLSLFGHKQACFVGRPYPILSIAIDWSSNKEPKSHTTPNPNMVI